MRFIVFMVLISQTDPTIWLESFTGMCKCKKTRHVCFYAKPYLSSHQCFSSSIGATAYIQHIPHGLKKVP